MSLFRRGLSEADNAEALKLVDHVQTLYAFQHLMMERYNDAVSSTPVTPHDGELSERSREAEDAGLDVTHTVLLALALKLDIIAEMERRHREFERPVVGHLARAYDACTRMLTAMRNRAEGQRAAWKQSAADAPTVDTAALDREELDAVEASVDSINLVISNHLKLKPAAFTEINRQATNYVRSTFGLAPLTEDEYGALYTAGMQGQSVRFYGE